MKSSADGNRRLDQQISPRERALRTAAFGLFLFSVCISTQSLGQSESKAWTISSSTDSRSKDVNDPISMEESESTPNETDAEPLTPQSDKQTEDLAADADQAQIDPEIAKELLESDSVESTVAANSESSRKNQKKEKNGTTAQKKSSSKKIPLTIVPAEAPPKFSLVPVIDQSPELRASLERQFEQILKLEEEEDAFSENLGEAYLGYGRLLGEVGRLEEARDMYAKALHISKINNGVYAIEQRPVLKTMFYMFQAQGKVEEMENYLKQVIWLERKQPDVRDNFSYDMVVALGNTYIDKYLAWPKITETSLIRINKSIHYLNYAIQRYSDLPLEEGLLPYGEMALLYYFKHRIALELNRSFYEFSRQRQFTEIDKFPAVNSRSNFLNSAQGYLKTYLKKAEEEGDIEHQVRALRDLGDINLLFERGTVAQKFYEKAWVLASDLPPTHELVTSFDQPNKLPDFNYAGTRSAYLDREVEAVYVPLVMNLDRFGRIKKILSKAEDNPLPKYVFRAKRESRKYVFRPPIDNGKMIESNAHEQEIRVLLRSRAVAQGPEIETESR